MQVKGLSEDSRSTLLSMTTEITYAEVRFKNEQPKSLGNASEAPVAPKEKTSTPKSNPGLLKLLLALVMILLLLTISFLIAFIIFFQKYSELIQEKQFKQETTHTILECKKEKLIMEVSTQGSPGVAAQRTGQHLIQVATLFLLSQKKIGMRVRRTA